MKSAHRQKHTFLNGTKGVISLLLCLVMCPFLTIALTLVESSRYQQAIETMNEVNNSAALSTLADKDSYLNERFGFLAASQDGSIDAKYQKYLQANWGAMGSGGTLNSASINFESTLSLGSQEVLKQQIVEFSELTVASKIVVDGLDLNELIAAIEALGNFEAIMDSLNAISATANVASATADLVKNINNILTALSDYETKYSAYLAAHNAFLDATVAMQTTMQEEMDADPNLVYPSEITPTPTPTPTPASPTPTPTPTPASPTPTSVPQKTSVYDNANVKTAMTTLDQKAALYKTACDNLATNVAALKESLAGITGNFKTVQDSIDALKELTEAPNSSDSSNLTNSATSGADIYQDILTIIETGLSGFVDEAAMTGLEEDIYDLQTTSSKLDTVFKTTSVKHTTTRAGMEANYPIIIIGVPSITTLNQALTDANNKLGGGDGGQSIITIIENMTNSIQEMFKISVFYDGTLDANINSDYLSSLVAATGSDTSPFQDVLESIKLLMDSAEDFKDALSSWDFFGALKAIKDAMTAIVDYFEAIIHWFKNVCDRVYELISGGPDYFYESMLVCGYCAYDFPNRTNCDDGSSMTGYSYADIQNATSSSSANIAGDLNALLDLLDNLKQDTSEDITFCGAELEYILIGSQSEIVNQSCTFTYLYLLRMIINILPICLNTEVSSMAGAATVGAPVVYALEFIIEPLLDTIVLVNGGTSYLIKRSVYMTPSGVLKLVDDLQSILAPEVQGLLKTAAGPKTGPATPPAPLSDFFKGSLLAVNYTDHMLFMMMFTKESDVLARAQHLIQMEAESHYKQAVSGFTFDINKTYAYLNFNLDVTMNPLFSVGNLSTTGYPYKKSVYRGY